MRVPQPTVRGCKAPVGEFTTLSQYNHGRASAASLWGKTIASRLEHARLPATNKQFYDLATTGVQQLSLPRYSTW